MIQAPNLVNPYMQPQMMQQYMPQPIAQPNYNAVKIDVHNPTVSAPGTLPQQMVNTNAPQYAAPTMPYYAYPQTALYDYPQAQIQPYYPPVTMPPAAQIPTPQVQMPAPQVQIPAPQAPVVTPQVVPQQINQQNINAPAPVVTQPTETKQAEVQTPKVEIQEPVPMTPQIDLNSFIAKLTSPDYEVQANAMEEIATMVKDEPQKATELLDEKVINALNTIVNTDSTKLAGPTQEQIAAREKLGKGEKISDTEKNLATTITPMEQAERNKSYAMFTASIMQKLYSDEVEKLTGSTVPLTELPGAVAIVEQLKNNPNPMVRTSAIEALSYIQQPTYKKDLNTLFTIAQNDQDANVQEAAKIALEKLAQVPDHVAKEIKFEPKIEAKDQPLSQAA